MVDRMARPIGKFDLRQRRLDGLLPGPVARLDDVIGFGWPCGSLANPARYQLDLLRAERLAFSFRRHFQFGVSPVDNFEQSAGFCIGWDDCSFARVSAPQSRCL